LPQSTPSSNRLYSQSSDSLRLPNRSTDRRFALSETRRISPRPVVTNDSCTVQASSPTAFVEESLATGNPPETRPPLPFRSLGLEKPLRLCFNLRSPRHGQNFWRRDDFCVPAQLYSVGSREGRLPEEQTEGGHRCLYS
jgi:hypothetical protein